MQKTKGMANSSMFTGSSKPKRLTGNREITEEREFLNITTGCERVVCHFFHEDFRRCAIMDEHLKKLAEKHFNTKFIKADVEKCKFFVAKLKVNRLLVAKLSQTMLHDITYTGTRLLT